MATNMADWTQNKQELKQTLELIYENELAYNEVEARLYDEEVSSISTNYRSYGTVSNIFYVVF